MNCKTCGHNGVDCNASETSEAKCREVDYIYYKPKNKDDINCNTCSGCDGHPIRVSTCKNNNFCYWTYKDAK